MALQHSPAQSSPPTRPPFPSPTFHATEPLLDERTRLDLLTIVAARIVEPARAQQLARFIDATSSMPASAGVVGVH